MDLGFPLTLEGEHVRLVPLGLEHVPALLDASRDGRDTYRLTQVPTDAGGMRAYVEEVLGDARVGAAVPFVTTLRGTGRVVGATRFLNVESWRWPGPRHEPVPRGPDAVEIGGTWLARDQQRTAVNTEAKLLMLRHAFETWGVYRVSLKTDVRNSRSRAAIERLGARFDGVLRGNMPAFDGGVRDSAYFSILRDEWPAVQERLEGFLRDPRP